MFLAIRSRTLKALDLPKRAPSEPPRPRRSTQSRPFAESCQTLFQGNVLQGDVQASSWPGWSSRRRTDKAPVAPWTVRPLLRPNPFLIPGHAVNFGRRISEHDGRRIPSLKTFLQALTRESKSAGGSHGALLGSSRSSRPGGISD